MDINTGKIEITSEKLKENVPNYFFIIDGKK